MKKTKDYTSVLITKESLVNISNEQKEKYLNDILQIEKAYPQEYRGDKESIIETFTDKNSRIPIGIIYYHKNKPVAYSLGSNLEVYEPDYYGKEIENDPDYKKFNSFYIENVSVIKSYQNKPISIRCILEISFIAKKYGFKKLKKHSRMTNEMYKIAKKMGSKELFEHKNFLDTGHNAMYMECSLK